MCYIEDAGRSSGDKKTKHDEACTVPGEPFTMTLQGLDLLSGQSTMTSQHPQHPGLMRGGRCPTSSPRSRRRSQEPNIEEEYKDEVIEVRPKISAKEGSCRLHPPKGFSYGGSLSQDCFKNVQKPESNTGRSRWEGTAARITGAKPLIPPTSDECKYHPGFPVFHEGMKNYWSCCQRKTSEFQHFSIKKGV